MLERLLALIRSDEFLSGVVVTLAVTACTRLLKLYLGRLARWWRNRRGWLVAARDARHRQAVDRVRGHDAELLRMAMGEMRTRNRSQTSLQWCVMLFSFSGFFLFSFIELDALLRVPPWLSILLMGAVLLSVVLFAVSLVDDKDASSTGSVLDEALLGEVPCVAPGSGDLAEIDRGAVEGPDVDRMPGNPAGVGERRRE